MMVWAGSTLLAFRMSAIQKEGSVIKRGKPEGPIRWTTLGNAPFPKPDEPCSGYLLQAGGANVLVDIGGGSLAALQHYIRLEDLHAVWISHLHADHFSDMPLLYYAFAFSENPLRKIPVLGPVGWAFHGDVNALIPLYAIG